MVPSPAVSTSAPPAHRPHAAAVAAVLGGGVAAVAAALQPIVGLALAVCLFSLAGVPPFFGFIGKFVVFRAAVNNGFVMLAVLGVINSLISAFYYLRVVYVLYMQPLPRRVPSFPTAFSISAAAALTALGVLVLGLYPTPILTAAQSAITALVR